MIEQVIYLVRHGQTYWNKKDPKIHQTHSDGFSNQLTKDGQVAVEALRKYFEARIDMVFTSPLRRTRETCSLLVPDTTRIETDNRLTELSLSFLDGMSPEDWMKKYPETKEIYEERDEDKFYYRIEHPTRYSRCVVKHHEIARENGMLYEEIPQFESYEDAMIRVSQFLKTLKQYFDANILIVGHQGINRLILGYYLLGTKHLLNIKDVCSIKIPQDGLYKIEVRSDGNTVYHSSPKGSKEGLFTLSS
ncbi:histidine phosphatase family protein [Candidatus Woesearchaeota archaeon]|nr:histidine phosphatase family protein [Candidatus Woesearchaeota archaeon]